MSIISEWGEREGVSPDAIARLHFILGLVERPPVQEDPSATPGSESRQSSLMLLDASHRDILLMRNNSGALLDQRGVPVRFGWGNVSAKQNEQFKSPDFLGIEKVLITPAHVGNILGRFIGVEMKHEGWRFNPKDKHEAAQWNCGKLILSYGGKFLFATGPGQV